MTPSHPLHFISRSVIALAFAWGGANAETRQDKVEHVRQIVEQAIQSNNGGLEVIYQGSPPEPLIATVADGFANGQVSHLAGTTVDTIVLSHCGYQSDALAKRVESANPTLFSNKVLSGNAGTVIKLTMPACLVSSTLRTVVIKDGESAATLADIYYGVKDATPEFCQMLAALNGNRDICQASIKKQLRIGEQVTIYNQKEAEALIATGVSRTLTVDQTATDAASLADRLVGAVPEIARLVIQKQARAILITPAAAGDCPRPSVAFSPRTLVETYARLVTPKDRTRNRIVDGQPVPAVTVGIIDTGLFGSTVERLKGLSGGKFFADGAPSRSITSAGDTSDIEPSSNDKFGDHGTHVTGLVLGGADLWAFLSAAKKGEETFPTDATAFSYLWSVLPYITFVKVTSEEAFWDPPSISADSVVQALFYLQMSHPAIINFSHKAPYSPTLQKAFTAIVDNGMFVVSAAGNDFSGSEIDNLYDADRPLISSMLTSNSHRFFVTVGAANETLGAPAPFSDRSSQKVDLFAPGTCLASFGPRDDVVVYSGTSQAAPLVSFTIAVLRALGVPPREVKFRILSTVDYGKEFAGSISGGVLNIPKAWDILDDIVVERNAPAGTYLRGELSIIGPDGTLAKDGRPCIAPSGPKNPAHETTLRRARRIVILDNGKVRLVPTKIGRFEYFECDLPAGLRFSLKPPGPEKAREIAAENLREIIPRPDWVTAP
ncbi:MAG TPA: S8/S53 family peptidase [Reyranella sp.]|nr:S8/S53 family peptidase [Reyranella sp.]